MDRILPWTVQSHGQWRSVSNELPPEDKTEDDHPILGKEVEDAVQSLKKGKSAGVNNIPEERVQAGGEDLITALTTICDKVWQSGERLTLWTQSLVITLPKKGNLQQHQNCRTISLISHPSKIMLKIKLNRSKPQAAKIIDEETQASEQVGAQQRPSTYESSVRNISSTSKTSTMSSKTSRRPSTGFGMQLCGQPRRSTTSAPTLSESSNTSMTKPSVLSSSA